MLDWKEHEGRNEKERGMETPSQWAKRFNREKAGEKVAGSPDPETAIVDGSSPVVDFPTEAFQCPACGQLLAPSCRVCVSCKHTINPAEIIQQPQQAAIASSDRKSTRLNSSH